MRWRPCLSLAIVCVLCAGVVAAAQPWPAIPPIPSQERFRPRTDLDVALKVSPSPLRAGEKPSFSLTLRNKGTRPLRVWPHLSVTARESFERVSLRLFTSGKELGATHVCIVEPAEHLVSVREFVRLLPGQVRSFPLTFSCDEFPVLRPGDYQLEATYRSYLGNVLTYDPYEAGAAEVWEGRQVTPRVTLKVLPLDIGTSQRLIALIDAPGTPPGLNSAIRSLALGADATATQALVRRFDRDAEHRVEIAWALTRIADPDAPGALAAAVARLPLDERTRFQTRRTALSASVSEAEPLITSPTRPAASDVRFHDEDRPDPASVAAYVRELLEATADPNDMPFELNGVARFGTVDDFLRLRAAFDSTTEDERGLLQYALMAMSFVSDRDRDAAARPAYWDGWWQGHAQMTRTQWAREALQREPIRSTTVVHDEAPSHAAEFLLANQGLSPALIRELSQHRSWLVRRALADSVARADEQSAGRLLLRELSNRDVSACRVANERLAALVRRRYAFDCTDPGERQQAIAHWTKVVDSMEPGFLPLTVTPVRP